MSEPVPVLSASFAQPPTAAPDWADLSAYLQGFSLTRGRTHPLEPFGAGRLTVTLDNGDRTFDPRHAGGPYYGLLKATRRLRLQVQTDTGTHDLIHTYLDNLDQQRIGYGDQVVTLPSSDAFSVFTTKLSTSFPEQSTSDRVDAVLDALGWVTGQAWLLGDTTFGELGTSTKLGPVGDRSLDAGVATCQAATLSGVPALAHMQAAADTELGRLFVSRSGSVTFHNRTRILLGGSGSLATFGDAAAAIAAGSELPYTGIRFRDQDRSTIYTEVRVTPDGLTEQVASDASSQEDHFVRTLSRASLTPDEADAASLATYLLSQYKQGTSWISGLTLDPREPTGGVFAQLFTRDLGDVVTVRYTPLGGGSRVEQASQIEGISLSWQAEGNVWAGEWSLSPVDALSGSYWVLNVGALGSTTALAL